jgi:RNA polymerase sigma-70 factor (ECF subfamily)
MTASMRGSLPTGGPLAEERPEKASAFWQMVEGLRPYLLRVAARMLPGQLRGKTDPSSIVQRSLLAAWANFSQLEGQDENDWQAWLLKILRNEVRELERYYHRGQRDVERERPIQVGSGEGLQPAADDSSPSKQAMRRERAEQVMAILEQLAPDHRQVLQLRNFDELSFTDIAQCMGRSHDAVRQLWVRAVAQFRQAWEAAYGSPAKSSCG